MRGSKSGSCGIFTHVSHGGLSVMRTIFIASCVSVQGVFVRALCDGRIVIRANDKEFTGFPVSKSAA